MREACLVFICEYGMHRSRTAAELFKPFFTCTRHCGVNPFSERPCHRMLLTDADVILVMEAWHAARLPRDVRERVVVLGIPSLPYQHPRLVRMLAERVPRALAEKGVLTHREAEFLTRLILEKVEGGGERSDE